MSAVMPIGWGFNAAAKKAHPSGEQRALEAGVTLARMRREGREITPAIVRDLFPDVSRATAYRWSSVMVAGAAWGSRLFHAGIALEQWATERGSLPARREVRQRFAVSQATAYRWLSCARSTLDILDRGAA